MRVLGIETSCDETGVALYCRERGLLAQALHSQVERHAEYGGVVPELASRDHIAKLLPLIEQVLVESDTSAAELDGIAYTMGPGLIGALLVGAATARSLAYALDVPAVGIHHMEAHLLAPQLDPNPPAMPFLALLVSGGHSMFVAVEGLGRYRILGDTLDDAVGEAFDKTAQQLGLGYPGGPALAALAEHGDPTRFRFARPLTDRPGLDLSFSGLKTQVLLAVRAHQPLDEATRADLARGFEEAVVDTLAIKCERALGVSRLDTLVVAGGVGANRRLRQRLGELGTRLGVRIVFPRPELCTDNGAMVAVAGALRLAAGERHGLSISVRPRFDLTELSPPA